MTTALDFRHFGSTNKSSGKAVVSTEGGAVTVTQTFTLQSQLSTTLLQAAISAQPPGQNIVPSTLNTQQISGYSVALSPMAQTPVAVEFLVGGKGSTTHILKPGEWLRPDGPVKFTGFRWGLPFGWLGGGVATLHVFQSRDAEVRWHTNGEVLFHRTTALIQANTGNPASVAANFPMRYPWTNATQGASAISQAGFPSIALTPTRIILRLRLATFTGGDMRLIVSNPDQIGDAAYYDLTWPVLAASGFRVGGTALHEFPLAVVQDPIMELGGDACALVPVDLTVGQGLAAAFVDILRYGTM